MKMTTIQLSISVPSDSVEDFALEHGWVQFTENENGELVEDISAVDFIKSFAKDSLAKLIANYTKKKNAQAISIKKNEIEQEKKAIENVLEQQANAMVNVQ